MILFLFTTHSLCFEVVSLFLSLSLSKDHTLYFTLFVYRFYTLSLSLFVYRTFSLVKLLTVIPFAFIHWLSQAKFPFLLPLQCFCCSLCSVYFILYLSFFSVSNALLLCPSYFLQLSLSSFLFQYHLTLLGLFTLPILFFTSISSPFFYTSTKMFISSSFRISFYLSICLCFILSVKLSFPLPLSLFLSHPLSASALP